MRKRILLIAWCLALTTAAFTQQTNEQLAAYYFDHGDYAQAAQLYESLYKQTTNRYYYQRLLSTYLELGEYRDALRLVERRQKAFPKDLTLMVDEGQVQMRQKQTKKAEKAFDKAIESITSNLQPVPDLAQAFIGAGRYDYAARTYLTARAKTKNRSLYFNEICGVYQQMGDYEAMTGEYFDLLDNSPGMMRSVQVSMQRALQDAPDQRLADGVRRALVGRVQEHPDNKTYLEMMICRLSAPNSLRVGSV